MEWCRLLHGDCLDLLPTLEAGSVDLVVADPPYGDTSLAWDVPVDAWLPLVARVLKPSGSLWCFGSLRFFMGQAGLFTGWRLAQDVVWEKQNGSGFHADRFKRVHEHAVQFYPASVSWAIVYKRPVNTYDAIRKTARRKKRPPHMGHIERGEFHSEDFGPRLMRSVIYARSCHGHAIHPTQKPVEIIDPLIRYSCPPGGMVLDPFMGSGSTGEAALRLQRSFIGIERDAGYFAGAQKRLDAVQAQGVLFEEVV